MAVTEFYGWTEDELLNALKSAQKDYASGASITGSGSGDINATRLVQSTPLARIRAIQKALFQLDPEKYADFGGVGQSQTVPIFR